MADLLVHSMLARDLETSTMHKLAVSWTLMMLKRTALPLIKTWHIMLSNCGSWYNSFRLQHMSVLASTICSQILLCEYFKKIGWKGRKEMRLFGVANWLKMQTRSGIQEERRLIKLVGRVHQIKSNSIPKSYYWSSLFNVLYAAIHLLHQSND